MNRLNKTESAVFLYCRFSLLFMKYPFYQTMVYYNCSPLVADLIILRCERDFVLSLSDN